MSVHIQGDDLRAVILGRVVSKAYTPLVVETKTLFTISGLCVITNLFGKVTTAITVANTVKLQANPTTGTTKDIFAATDLGTTDTPAGSLISTPGLTGDTPLFGAGVAPLPTRHLVIDAGTIEQVTATGADGGITWYVTYVPIETGATIVAA
jgi:hypothetical protein